MLTARLVICNYFIRGHILNPSKGSVFIVSGQILARGDWLLSWGFQDLVDITRQNALTGLVYGIALVSKNSSDAGSNVRNGGRSRW